VADGACRACDRTPEFYGNLGVIPAGGAFELFPILAPGGRSSHATKKLILSPKAAKTRG